MDIYAAAGKAHLISFLQSSQCLFFITYRNQICQPCQQFFRARAQLVLLPVLAYTRHTRTACNPPAVEQTLCGIIVGCFLDGNSALMLVCARLRHVAGAQWGNKKYMNMKHLEAICEDASVAI